MKLSIIIPCYNELRTLPEIVRRVVAIDIGKIEKEIIIVDDGSTDGCRELLHSWNNSEQYKILYHDNNKGKGTALRTGISYASGDIITFQDADLELDPRDLVKLIKPIIEGEYAVVYGSRFLTNRNSRSKFSLFQIGNTVLTKFANILYDVKLSDLYTCYKVFRSDILNTIPLTCTHFEFCPEITSKVLKMGMEIKEMQVSYKPRSITDGKKIKWHDGLDGLWTLIKFRFKN